MTKRPMRLPSKTIRRIAVASAIVLALALALGIVWRGREGGEVVGGVEGGGEAEVAVSGFRHPLDGAAVGEETEDLPGVYAVMIDNAVDAWPPSGIERAFLVIEAPVEAGIPRYEAFFAADAAEAVDKIGPVRSARPYFVDWANEFDALYAHVGGSNAALEVISSTGTFDLNEFYNASSFWRASDRYAPHNAYTSTELLAAAVGRAEERGRAPDVLYGVWEWKGGEGVEGVGGVGGGEVVEKKTKEEKANEQGGVRGGDGLTEKDDEEVRGIVEARKVAPLEPALVTDTKAAAEKIAAGAAVTFASGEMRTRFEHIMDARLRDVRDGFETRARLEAPAEQGGLGLSGAPLVAVMEAVEAMDAAHHAALGVELAKKKEALKAEKGARAEQVGQLASDDAQVMAKRYAELTGKAPKEMVVPTPSRATAAIPAAEAVARRAQQIDTGKVRAAIDAAKAEAPKVTPVLSAGSVARVASGRPTVNDVVFERKLAGPVEELRLLTLADFRRLSKDPEDAARKIEAKVELVSAEGYDQRIAAIRAWRESPLVRLYVELSREALLSGKGIDDLLSGRRAAGEDMPTEAELKAVVDLNGTLRF